MPKLSFLALLILLLLTVPALAFDVSPAEAGPMPGPGEVYGSYMGIDIQEVTHDRMSALNLKEERGAEITMVDHDSPAGKAGLKEHDVILEFNGTKVEGTEELRRLIHETPPGRTVQLLISRNGQPMNISLQLADKKEYFAGKHESLEDMPGRWDVPAMPSIDLTVRTGPSYGLVVDSLTPQLGEYFGVKNGEGVLVKSVEAGTPGKAAGFKAGDVIVRVNNQKVADRGDWRAAVRAHRSGKLTVGIVRDRHEQTLTINVPESSRNHSALWVPDALDLDLDLDLDELGEQLAALQPTLEHVRILSLEEGQKALKNARKAMTIDTEEIGRSVDKAMKALEQGMKECEKDREKEQKETERPLD
jgi:membrane-associated protease RseP (regulator of RpoE activity)